MLSGQILYTRSKIKEITSQLLYIRRFTQRQKNSTVAYHNAYLYFTIITSRGLFLWILWSPLAYNYPRAAMTVRSHQLRVLARRVELIKCQSYLSAYATQSITICLMHTARSCIDRFEQAPCV